MKKTVLISMTIAAALLTTITTMNASAQSRYRYSEREVREIAYRNGFRFGVREGRYDRQSGDKFDFKRSRAYKNGKYEYRDEYRHEGDYKDSFREGFANGYKEGFNGLRGFGRRDDDRSDRYNDDRRYRDDVRRRDGDRYPFRY